MVLDQFLGRLVLKWACFCVLRLLVHVFPLCRFIWPWGFAAWRCLFAKFEQVWVFPGFVAGDVLIHIDAAVIEVVSRHGPLRHCDHPSRFFPTEEEAAWLMVGRAYELRSVLRFNHLGLVKGEVLGLATGLRPARALTVRVYRPPLRGYVAIHFPVLGSLTLASFLVNRISRS